jgi:UDP-N-acetylglucosamine 2-epimerase (non-hydrolysing)
MPTRTIHLIAAARPNFMKVAPLYHALEADGVFEPLIVHTGQHYDVNMSDAFFDDLGMPEPHFHLGIGSGTHAEQTAGIMVAYEKVLMKTPPALTVVVGDVNSTVACTIAAKKLCQPVAHLEAGLRSRDWTMPEEINRILTDSISDLLWTPSHDANENLLHEGIATERISLVGNIMIDSYEMMRERIEQAGSREALGLDAKAYGVVTLHRPSNVDHEDMLTALVDVLCQLGTVLPLVFTLHPRTRKNLETFRLRDRLEGATGVLLSEPLNYTRFMNLVSQSRLVITDSGGLQEETTYLGIPCLTLRDNTERPITVTQGTNRLLKPDDLSQAVEALLAGEDQLGTCPALWDGNTAGRIVEDLKTRGATLLA